MKKLIWSLVGGLSLAMPLYAQGPEGEKAVPAAQVEGEKDTYFTTRHLRVKNDTAETLTVFVQYRTLVEGKWVWKPGEADSGMAMSFEIAPGADMVLEDDGAKIAASRVRLWAKGDKLQMLKHRDQDLWLVPEVDADQHRYKAASIETYSHVFVADKSGEPATPAIPATPEPLPAPIPEPLPVLPPPEPMPLPPLDPGFPKEPPPLKVADLAAENLVIDKTGAFKGTIRNMGPGFFVFGRQWFLLKFNKAGGNYQVVKSGIIPPMIPLGKKDVVGSVGPIMEKSKFVLAITKGDDYFFNDRTSPVTVLGPKTDLAVTGLKLVGTMLEGTITNLGPDDYNTADRTFALGDALALVAPKKAVVPNLAMGAKTTISLDVKTALDVKNKFSMKLNAGDDKAFNDSKELSHEPQADLVVTELKVVGKVLVGKIVNQGPQKYTAGRTYKLGSGFKNKDEPVPALAKGAFKTVMLDIDSVDHLKQTFQLKLSAGDAHPLNDVKKLDFEPKKVDLAVVGLSKVGNNVKATVKNLGDAKSGVRSLTISYKMLGSWMKLKTVAVPALNPGQMDITNAVVPPLATAVKVELNHVPGDSPVNDEKQTP